MKKISILVVFLAAYYNNFANLTQANWRWRNDDGSQTTASWKAAQNIAIVVPADSTGEVLRLRLEVYNNTGSSLGLLDTLQYATSTEGPWINLDTLADFNPFVIAGTSPFVVQDEPTTAQLTGVDFTFVPGKIMIDSMILENFDLEDNQRTEFEWAIVGTSNTAPHTTYYFRQLGKTKNPLDSGMTYPSLTTAAPLPIKLTGFTVNREDKKIRLEWSTASEQNNNRFEIQRASDGKTWQTIAKINGHGASASSNTYLAYDESPLSGISYYVIKHYDVDSRSYFSVVKSVRMPEATSIITVYPNPAHSAINFIVVNKETSNVEAILTNLNGMIIQRETFKNVSANTINKLKLAHQPGPGVYILKLKAAGVSESVRVIIE